jgi:surfeit locus 1 family protein
MSTQDAKAQDLHSRSAHALFSAVWWGLLGAALLVAGITARLGWWQLERAHAKEAVHDMIQSRQQEPVLRNADWGAEPAPEAWLQRRVEVQGVWLPRFTVYLDNRSMKGQPGFYVLTPLELPHGPVLWVQRGWVARDRVRSDWLPPIATPQGQVTIEARVVPPPSRLMELGSSGPSAEGFSTLRHNVDLEAFRSQTGLPLVATLQQTDAASDGLLRDWPQALSGSDKNRGYAFQWFALSLLSLLLFAWFQVWKKLSHD